VNSIPKSNFGITRNAWPCIPKSLLKNLTTKFIMSKYLNKYRNESFRAQWWNYSNEGSYFITICAADRKLILGEIYNKEMHLSPIGEIVYEEWNKSFEIRTELFCDIFVIMPNHIHAILRIEKSCRDGQPSMPNNIDGQPSIPPNTDANGGTDGRPAIHFGDGRPAIPTAAIPTISSFIAGFKSAATKRINEYRNTPKTPVWQKLFHDRIIRDANEYDRIFNYIKNNIEKWGY
jgi:REP element-mobilizing transposase RayT